MTYAVGFYLDTGLVFAADSRTNAGVDQISTFRKLTIFDKPGDRVLVLLGAGNLAISQAVVETLRQGIKQSGIKQTGARSKGKSATADSLMTAPNMFDAARIVGEAVRAVHKADGEALRQFDTDFNVSLIFGGQIKGEAHRLFQIYAAGNFIEASADSPYFQIGENKYGKPILDRIISHRSTLMEAAKCALLSFDSTMRSNISVGPPIDIIAYRKDSLKRGLQCEVTETDSYFRDVRTYWGDGLRSVFQNMPDPDWKI